MRSNEMALADLSPDNVNLGRKLTYNTKYRSHNRNMGSLRGEMTQTHFETLSKCRYHVCRLFTEFRAIRILSIAVSLNFSHYQLSRARALDSTY